MTAPSDPLLLHRRVLELLTEDRFPHAGRGSGRDGVDVLSATTTPAGCPDHVVVVHHFEGLLCGLATPGVRNALYYGITRVLTDAGLAVAPILTGEARQQYPQGLAVATDQEAAHRAVESVRSAAPMTYTPPCPSWCEAEHEQVAAHFRWVGCDGDDAVGLGYDRDGHTCAYLIDHKSPSGVVVLKVRHAAALATWMRTRGHGDLADLLTQAVDLATADSDPEGTAT